MGEREKASSVLEHGADLVARTAGDDAVTRVALSRAHLAWAIMEAVRPRHHHLARRGTRRFLGRGFPVPTHFPSEHTKNTHAPVGCPLTRASFDWWRRRVDVTRKRRAGRGAGRLRPRRSACVAAGRIRCADRVTDRLPRTDRVTDRLTRCVDGSNGVVCTQEGGHLAGADEALRKACEAADGVDGDAAGSDRVAAHVAAAINAARAAAVGPAAGVPDAVGQQRDPRAKHTFLSFLPSTDRIDADRHGSTKVAWARNRTDGDILREVKRRVKRPT